MSPYAHIVCKYYQSSEKFWLGKNTGSAGQNPVFIKNQADFWPAELKKTTKIFKFQVFVVF
jgi:hypothetical protein